MSRGFVKAIEMPTQRTTPLPDGSTQRVIVEVLYAHQDAPPKGQVAQLVEHVTENHGVAGSIPALATRFPNKNSHFDASLSRAFVAGGTGVANGGPFKRGRTADAAWQPL
jgi:hypothetical protein